MAVEQDETGPFSRFLEAQATVYPNVVRELRHGRKETHWMWFVFPQMAGLSRSEMARRFALGSAREARLYAGHGLLGKRLRECTRIVVGLADHDPRRIFGSPDDVKFRSSMTLFEAAVPEEPLFAAALEKFFDGSRDELTLRLLRRS